MTTLIDEIAWACVAAGVLLIVLGFVVKDPREALRDATKSALEKATDQLDKPVSPAAGIGGTAQRQTAIVGAAGFLPGLAELAKGLSGLSRAIQASILALVLFFFAAGLAALHAVG